MKHTLTPDQRTERVERRATLRERAAAKVGELRQWREARAEQAAKATREERLRRLEEPRGVHRVPARYRGLEVTVEPHLFGKRDVDQERPLAQPEDLHPSGNHETRRSRGQRGKPRRPRRRELPGAEARRVERNRKEWLA